MKEEMKIKQKSGRNDPCPICGTKMKNCQGHRRFNPNSIVSILLIMGIGVVFIFLLNKTDKSMPRLIDSQPQTILVNADDIKPIWNIFHSNVIDKLESNTHEMVELNNRYRYLLDEIIKNEKVRFNIVVSATSIINRGVTDKGVMASATYIEGRPMIKFYGPKLFEAYSYYKSTGEKDWIIEFCNNLTVTIFHELDHLALQHPRRLDATDLKQFIVGEAEAWAETCRYVIDPMKKSGRLNIASATHVNIYRSWLTVRGDTSNPLWASYMEKIMLENK